MFSDWLENGNKRTPEIVSEQKRKDKKRNSKNNL